MMQKVDLNLHFWRKRLKSEKILQKLDTFECLKVMKMLNAVLFFRNKPRTHGKTVEAKYMKIHLS